MKQLNVKATFIYNQLFQKNYNYKREKKNKYQVKALKIRKKKRKNHLLIVQGPNQDSYPQSQPLEPMILN